MENTQEQVTEQVEKVKGLWIETNSEVEFKRIWGGHRFTDEEVESLLNGDELILRNLQSKTGEHYSVRGKLAKQKYKGKNFVGYKSLEFLHDDSVPESWCHYKFNAAEITALEAGDSIPITGAVNKVGKVFDCRVRYGIKEDGKKGIIAEFDNK